MERVLKYPRLEESLKHRQSSRLDAMPDQSRAVWMSDVDEETMLQRTVGVGECGTFRGVCDVRTEDGRRLYGFLKATSHFYPFFHSDSTSGSASGILMRLQVIICLRVLDEHCYRRELQSRYRTHMLSTISLGDPPCCPQCEAFSKPSSLSARRRRAGTYRLYLAV